VRDDLLTYYERELTYLRQLGAEFAAKYPKVAARLLLEPSRCEDPHVERLIEAFAFLAARIHLKIDDEFPELTQALLGILYPHYIRPIPSMTVVEFHLDPQQGQLTGGLKIPRHSTLFARPVSGYRCPFRTSSEVTLFPLRLTEAQWMTPERLDPPVKSSDAAYALRLRLELGPQASFEKMGLNALRLFLNGEAGVVYPLYEMLCNHTLRILLRDGAPNSRHRPITLSPNALTPYGFAEEEGLLPYPRRSFEGYRLLQEYFSFPEKYLFLDLGGLEPLAESGFDRAFEAVFLMEETERREWEPILQMGVSAKTVRLNCAPAINLFPHTADPILVEGTRHEYPVTPDARRPDMFEVFSIEDVVATNPTSMEVVRFEPFYSYRHTGHSAKQRLFWHATRRASKAKFDENTELWITLVDLEGRGRQPEYDTLTLRCLCTNREIPSKLPIGTEAGDFDLEGGAPLQKIVSLRKPSSTLRPPLGSGAFWRLISHLSLNYLSLVEEGREALQEILRLYTPGAVGAGERQIEGIVELSSQRHFARVASEAGISFVRGTRVSMTLDEEYFVGSGAYLFASVLDRFLGLYVSLNSFSQLEMRTVQRKEVVRRWPARAGHGILL
jgi:type VI secretion system protein ImpG